MKLTRAISQGAVIIMAVSLLAISAVAQEKNITARDVPAAVMSAFKTAYPNATIRGYAYGALTLKTGCSSQAAPLVELQRP